MTNDLISRRIEYVLEMPNSEIEKRKENIRHQRAGRAYKQILRRKQNENNT